MAALAAATAQAGESTLRIRYCAKVRVDGAALKKGTKVTLRTDLILQNGSAVERNGAPGTRFDLSPSLEIKNNGWNCVSARVGADADMTSYVAALVDASRPSKVARAENARAEFIHQSQEMIARPTGGVWVTRDPIDTGNGEPSPCRQSRCEIGIFAILDTSVPADNRTP
jgi:hypothetical protein